MKKENINFTLLMAATIISSLGSYAFNFAFMSYMFDISGGNKSFMGLTQLFFVAGMLSGNILAGPVAEKSNRKNLLIFCEVIRIPLSLVFIFTQNIWGLLITHGLKTIFAGISTPAKRSFINDIIPKENITKANNIFSASYALIHITGPLLGTWGYSYFGGLKEVVLFDTSTFIIAPVIFFLIKISHYTPAQKSHFISDIKEGINFIKNRIDLRGLYERHALIGVFSGLFIPLILPFLHDVLAKDKKEYGIAMVLFGLGGVIGAILHKKFIAKFGLGKILYITSFIEPFLLLIWGLGLNYYLCQFIFLLWGVLFFTRVPAQFSYLSHYVDKNFISRTNAVLDFIFTLTNISASAVITILGAFIATQNFILACAALYIVITLIRARSKESHSLYYREDT